MKKVFCLSFAVFATTLTLLGHSSNIDSRQISGRSFVTSTQEMPTPVPGCSTVPRACPSKPPASR
jgi:hypothetical protein